MAKARAKKATPLNEPEKADEATKSEPLEPQKVHELFGLAESIVPTRKT